MFKSFSIAIAKGETQFEKKSCFVLEGKIINPQINTHCLPLPFLQISLNMTSPDRILIDTRVKGRRIKNVHCEEPQMFFITCWRENYVFWYQTTIMKVFLTEEVDYPFESMRQWLSCHLTQDECCIYLCQWADKQVLFCRTTTNNQETGWWKAENITCKLAKATLMPDLMLGERKKQ